MTTVDRLFEAHLRVSDLEASVAFYHDVLGFEVAHVAPERRAAFLWIGHRGQAMLGLWAHSAGAAADGPSHVAFATSIDEVFAAPSALRAAGVVPLDFEGRPTETPIVLGWMPAVAVYFSDPDGHLLEYFAMIDDEARPDAGVVDWEAWARERHTPPSAAHDAALHILAICGSLRQGSSNRTVLDAAALAAPPGVRVSIFTGLDAIPPFSPDLDVERAPGSVARFRRELKRADAIVISSPEYAHGVSGVMKNALDWVVGSGEMIDKPTALINATSRAVIAHAALRETLVTMSARVIDEASVTVPMDGRRLDATALAADAGLAGILTRAMAMLAVAARRETP